MLAQIITENGQKKIVPLTTDAGAGNPVGTIIPMYKKVILADTFIVTVALLTQQNTLCFSHI